MRISAARNSAAAQVELRSPAAHTIGRKWRRRSLPAHILAPLSIEWKQQGKIWSPQTTQIEFGKALRDFEADEDKEDIIELEHLSKKAH